MLTRGAGLLSGVRIDAALSTLRLIVAGVPMGRFDTTDFQCAWNGALKRGNDLVLSLMISA
ncbi:hypothetical protein CK507_04930 [Pseudomonas sp. WN033]|nr:hypothetical protein CK507_04930 [Pseudomonas sp. WN033]